MADILPHPATETHPLAVARPPGIHRIVLSNPPGNALSVATLQALFAALDAAAADPACRVVVLAATGEAFSTGHDLRELTAHRGDADGGKAFFAETMALSAALMQAIARHPRPVIAEVAGPAIAAGCELVAVCDLAIAAEEASFSAPGVTMGLLAATPTVALTRSMAPKHALEMMLTGETIDARAARDFGLVNRVVPAEYLPAVVQKYASAIAAKSPRAVSSARQAFRRQADLPLAEAYAEAAGMAGENLMSPEAAEGIAAFLEGRQPNWSAE